MVFGKLPDLYGRKKVLSYAMIGLLLFSMLCAFSHNAWQFLILRCIVGLSMGVTFPTCVVYGAEIIKSKYRELGPLIGALVSTFAVFGVSLSAYLLLLSIGWRWFIVFNTIPVVICFVFVRFVPESPRYLLVNKKYKEAQEALRTMAKWNNKNLPKKFNLKEPEEESIGSYKVVFSPQYRKEIVLLSTAGFCELFILFSFVVFFPLALNSGFCGGDLSPPKEKCVKIGQDSLKDLCILTTSGIFACVLGLFSAIFLGRKLSWRISSLFGLISSLFLITCINMTVTMVLLFTLKFSVIYHNIVSMILLPETFPTTIRGTSICIIGSVSKLGGTIGCGLVYILFFIRPIMVVGMFILVSLIQAICSFVWTKETKDFIISDTSIHQLQQE